MKLPLKPPAVIAVILARFQYESALIEQTWIMELQYGSLPRWILQKKARFSCWCISLWLRWESRKAQHFRLVSRVSRLVAKQLWPIPIHQQPRSTNLNLYQSTNQLLSNHSLAWTHDESPIRCWFSWLPPLAWVFSWIIHVVESGWKAAHGFGPFCYC